MSECYRKWFLQDGNKKACVDFPHTTIYSGESTYEVIRMIKGVPLFFSDHMQRLRETIRAKGRDTIADSDLILSQVHRLAELNGIDHGNVKLVFNYPEEEEGKIRFMVFFVEHHYPTEFQYNNGVPALLYFAERAFPSAKIINMQLR